MKKIQAFIILTACILLAVFAGCKADENTKETEEEVLCSTSDSVKSAAFLYTGEGYFIGDFVLSGNVFTVEEESESGKTGCQYDDLRKTSDECFEISYWYDYSGTGYPAIEILWDTDKVACFSISVCSLDGEVEIPFGEDGVFYRSAEENGENIDCSGKLYYFKESEQKTDIEERNTENIMPNAVDAKLYDNPKTECGENEAAAYIKFEDSAGKYQYRYDGEPCTLKAENTVIKGEGDYVAVLTCDTPVNDVKYAALCVDMGEKVFPGYTYYITAITVNGKVISCSKAYTGSEDGSTSYTYIFNPAAEMISEDARCASEDVSECSAIIIPVSYINGWTELKVYFTVSKPGAQLDYKAKTEAIHSQLNG